MKVLVQDLETLRFLSANGRWVGDREQARDFFSLLPAYYFARDHTSRHFQVILYSREDNFCASIIAGQGLASKKPKVSVAQPGPVKVDDSRKDSLHPFKGVFLPSDFDEIRRHLN